MERTAGGDSTVKQPPCAANHGRRPSPSWGPQPLLEHDYAIQIVDAALPSTEHGEALCRGTRCLRPLAVLHAGALLRRAVRGGPRGAGRFQARCGRCGVAVSVMTDIPVSKLGVDERARYAHMVDALHQRIIGQDDAVLSVSRAVKIARVGLKDPKRPIGSFLFLGPTGVGKTELAKALAEFMFGSEDAMVVLDMTEYQQDHTVNRLIGAPPGYVGYEGGGQLTEKVRQRPHTVVLFDEVEKAHPRVLDVLLQIMEEGRLTDARAGRRASARSHPDDQQHDHLPDSPDDGRDARAGDGGRATLRPEFLNRIDEIVCSCR